MLVLASLLGVASIGQTLVVLIGGIDLSTPFVIGFANVVAAQLYGDGMNFVLVCVIVGVLALVIGAVNGALSSTLAIHPLIVTLGVGTAIQGAVLLWTAGFPAGSAPEAVTKFVSIGGHAGPLPVPWLVPSFLVLIAIMSVVLARTPFGRRLYAVGSNPQRGAIRADLAARRLDRDLRLERACSPRRRACCSWGSPARPTATSASPIYSRRSPPW